jgi:LacI family transcriptional regulator
MARVTLQDVASHVGVDRSTVSRVLSNKAAEGGISDQLAARIVRKAQELNYIPNGSARAIRVGRFNCAALLMSTVAGRSYLPSRLLDGIHDELAAHDMHLTVAKLPDERLNNDEEYVPKILRTLMADGVIINYTNHLPEHLVSVVSRGKFPAVWINMKRGVDAVYPRNFEAANQATQRLINAGHRRIAYVDLCAGSEELSAAHFSATDRLAGYLAAMRDAGLSSQELRPRVACETFESESEFIAGVLRRPDRPTALGCYFSVCVPALLRIAAELGVRIPQDLSLITFGAESDRERGAPVSAMLEPHYQMGQQAVRTLCAKIDAPNRTAEPSELSFIWQDAGTCVGPS